MAYTIRLNQPSLDPGRLVHFMQELRVATIWVFNEKTEEKEVHRVELSREERDNLIKQLQQEVNE